ncbi:MAG: isopenicillin N synthase family dioxygenase [Myxococcota bacterium]
MSSKSPESRSAASAGVPEIDVAPLFGGPDPARDAVDARILEAACGKGFMTLRGAPLGDAVDEAARARLLRLFSLPADEQRNLWKRNFEPGNPNLYRGWFPLESGAPRSREGFEIGPDIDRDLPDAAGDLLYEPSVFPPESLLPGWRAAARAYYRAMETLGGKLLCSLSRGLGISEAIFLDAFRDGISTLRLLRYPERDLEAPAQRELESLFTRHAGRRVELVCLGHVDSGLITILSQCGVPGLQAEAEDGLFVDVPLVEDGFAVNFGGLLSRWTGGRIKATKHRVVSTGGERFSIPFFFEPRPSALIAPLPLEGVQPFEPFLFGDHLWATTTKFPENLGLAHLRPARAPYRDPFEAA